MSSNLAARNQLVSWQVAPAEYEIAHYDEPKIRYRNYVKEIINSMPTRSLKKKPFFVISTNVLCVDLDTSKESVDPIDRDVYLPLEISITKFKLLDWTQKVKVNQTNLQEALTTKVWLIHPGNPTRGNICNAKEHCERTHKIDYYRDGPEQNQYIEKDISKVLKEINSFLTPDRTVYSMNLQSVRQDLGSLKWLNRETGYKINPIKVYSLEDLFVVLFRKIFPEFSDFYGLGFARAKLNEISDTLDPNLQCSYHGTHALSRHFDCICCAKSITFCNARKLIIEISKYSVGMDETEAENTASDEASDERCVKDVKLDAQEENEKISCLGRENSVPRISPVK